MSFFNEDDDEETGSRNRHRERPNAFNGSKKGSLIDDRVVVSLIDQLDGLEQKTRPTSGPDAAGKDLAAFQALAKASWLVNRTAGWAIDHQRGLAQKGLQFVPLGTSQTKDNPDYLAQVAAVDTHDHERRGSERIKLTPNEARLFVLNILRPMSLRLDLPKEFIEALEALEFGETLPILAKRKTTKRTGLIEFRAKLAAVAFIEYQYVKGVKKYASTEIVADKFAVGRDAVKDWPVEVRAALGNLEVHRTISTAQNSARNYLQAAKQDDPDDFVSALDMEDYEERFGLPALLEAAERYKGRSKKSS